MNIIIVGAGVSGLTAGISLLRNGNDVTILERNNMSGKKLLLTGAGRCNYFNDSQSIQVAYIDNNNLLHVFGSTRIAARITNKGITTISRQAKRNQIKIDNGECIIYW